MANELYGSIMRGGVCYGGVGDPAVINQVSDNIAPKQETNTASELIPAGKYFVNSEGKLCQCDVQIASGGTIIVGSNCHLIPDGGINELNGKVVTEDILSQISINEGYNLLPSYSSCTKIGSLVLIKLELQSTLPTTRTSVIGTVPSALRSQKTAVGYGAALNADASDLIFGRTVIFTADGRIIMYTEENVPTNYYIDIDVIYTI